MEAEYRAVTMLCKSGLCLFYFLLGWMCQTCYHVEKCCFLFSDEGEKFRVDEAGIVHISLAVRF